jgi:Secretion system C-terminal sorting domain
MSSNNGLLWTAINSGLTDTLVTALVINNDTIYAGTNGGGVWKQAISDIIVGVKEINNNAGDIVVYPNPANNIITIENSSFIKGQTISVCDVRGQLLLQQPMQKAKTNINITTFSKGLYFIKVQNERGIAVRKFVKE